MSALLSLLASPVARIALVALSAFTFGYFKGESSARNRAAIATLEAKILTLNADIAISTAQNALAEKQARDAESIAAENQRIVDDLAKTKSCALSADDARRLRGIR